MNPMTVKKFAVIMAKESAKPAASGFRVRPGFLLARINHTATTMTIAIANNHGGALGNVRLQRDRSAINTADNTTIASRINVAIRPGRLIHRESTFANRGAARETIACPSRYCAIFERSSSQRPNPTSARLAIPATIARVRSWSRSILARAMVNIVPPGAIASELTMGR
jgi:hypothetical protein